MYYEQRVDALLKSWPKFDELEVRHMTERQCSEWADKARSEMAPTVFNHTRGILRGIFDFGIQAGARYNNPAEGIMRESETGKHLVLPDHETCQKFLTEIENGGGGTSRHCANLVRFLAFGGFQNSST